MEASDVLKELKSQQNPHNVAGMARFGINPDNTYGIPIPVVRKMAARIGKDHQLALALWKSGIHEARILAGMVDDSWQVTETQMEAWVKEFDSWDVCDQVCMNLFDKTTVAYQKAIEWSGRKEEFVKRAGFALMACLAVHDKSAPESKFVQFFPYIKGAATDERNFVKKAVNWALRQIGKRNESLRQAAIKTAQEIQKFDSKAAKWIAGDALRELTKK